MKTADADILIVPGWQDSGPDHWQSRWEKSLKTARRVIQDDWDNPNSDTWTGRIAEAVASSHRPVILVGHSLGVPAIAHAGHKLRGSKVRGAFLVAPADTHASDRWPDTGDARWPPAKGAGGFDLMPSTPLPFPSMLVIANNDPYCTLDRARHFAELWGSTLVEAGEAGHINVASGNGPWPEGLMRFGLFMRELG